MQNLGFETRVCNQTGSNCTDFSNTCTKRCLRYYSIDCNFLDSRGMILFMTFFGVTDHTSI